MTTSPTQGEHAQTAAQVQRYKIGYPTDSWGERSSTPSGIPDHAGAWVRYADHAAELRRLHAQVAALTAAPAQPAAPQGVAYASDDTTFLCGKAAGRQEVKDEQQTPDFASWIHRAYRDPESTAFTIHNMEVAYQAGRASNGQAPAGAAEETESRCANCGKPASESQERIADYPEEGEWFCSVQCKDQHEELDCPHLTHGGYRHPAESERLIACEAALRSLASWLGVGGYNSDSVDAKVFEEKIRWGVEHLLQSSPTAQAAPAAFQRALDIRVAQGWKLGGDKVPVLYTDSINGEQVCRDDLWLCTTAALDERAAPAAGAVAGPSLQEIQWRNIRKVVDALADFCFGSQDDPRWGVAHVAIRTSLTAKGGLDVQALKLEPLVAPTPPAQADSPAEAVERIVHLRSDRARRIYVAGPMTGLPEFNFPLFNDTAKWLRHSGWHVENPAEHGHIEGAGWADYLRWDISRIATCGAIYLLPGWEKSKGASLEVHIASVLGLEVLLAFGAHHPDAIKADSVLEDAARWNEVLMHVGAANHLGGQHFTLNTLRIRDQMFLLRGSVAQHFTACIDDSRAARKQGAKHD